MELLIDQLVGLTHHFAGLSKGNLPSMQHSHTPSSPKKAALEGLEKMKIALDLGVAQAVLPPQRRPAFSTLRQFGFQGSDEEVAQQTYALAPHLFEMCTSSSGMWMANAASVTASLDTKEHKLQLSLANLGGRFHRSLEPMGHEKALKRLFAKVVGCEIHPPLPVGGTFGDEGANLIRLTSGATSQGVYLLVYGYSAFDQAKDTSYRFSPRQSLEGQEALVRKHGLGEEHYLLVKQSKEAIEHGVFHNDLIAFGYQNVLICHEKAFDNTDEVLHKLNKKWNLVTNHLLEKIVVTEEELSLKEAVSTYLFNTLPIELQDGTFALLVPKCCKNHVKARALLDKWLASSPLNLSKVLFVNLEESLKNGGGPACLTLKVPLSEGEFEEIDKRYLLSSRLHKELVSWVERHYSNYLELSHLKEPSFLVGLNRAYEELNALLPPF